MRISRSSAETPDFENLLTPAVGDEAAPAQTAGLADPFADAPLAGSHEGPAELGVERPIPPPVRSLRQDRPYWRESTFLRAVGVPYRACVTALCDWSEGGVVELRRGRLVVPSTLAQRVGGCTIRARLRRGPAWSPPMPMELELIPWSQTLATTWLALFPRRRVLLSRRYFRAGHALLDEVAAGLQARAG